MSGNPFYYFFQDIPYDVWMMMSTFLIAVLIITIAICVTMSVFEALSLFTIAKRRGIPNYGCLLYKSCGGPLASGERP